MGNKSLTYQKGVWAERFAAVFLILKGYRICSVRYKTPVGEVDLIMRRGRSLVFCEVKYRRDYEQGITAISPISQRRIQRAASLFIAGKDGLAQMDMRFDAIIISPPFYIKHLRNAWTS